MVFVVEGGKESLLGRRDHEALGVIVINPKGYVPLSQQQDVESVTRVEMLQKPAQMDRYVSSGQTQKQIDNKMERLVSKFPEVFSGIGNVKIDPIHIHRRKNGWHPVVKELCTIALHLMWPLKKTPLKC